MQVSYFKFQEKKKCETLSMRNLISTSFPMYVFNNNTKVARESGVTQDDDYYLFSAAQYSRHISPHMLCLCFK